MMPPYILQEISREFDASIPYTVARVYMGYIDEVLPATDTMILTGDIVMEEMDVSRVSLYMPNSI